MNKDLEHILALYLHYVMPNHLSDAQTIASEIIKALHRYEKTKDIHQFARDLCVHREFLDLKKTIVSCHCS